MSPDTDDNPTARRLATVLLVAMALLVVGGIVLYRTAWEPPKVERAK